MGICPIFSNRNIKLFETRQGGKPCADIGARWKIRAKNLLHIHSLDPDNSVLGKLFALEFL